VKIAIDANNSIANITPSHLNALVIFISIELAFPEHRSKFARPTAGDKLTARIGYDIGHD
jgi:hypothetical protein